MAEEKPKPKPAPAAEISDDTYGRMYAGPAIHANRVFSTAGADGFRLVFMEQHERVVPQFRVAVFLPLSTAMGLRDLLNRQLDRVGGYQVSSPEEAREIEREFAEFMAKRGKRDGSKE